MGPDRPNCWRNRLGFGHRRLGGIAKEKEEVVKKRRGIGAAESATPTRSVSEVNRNPSLTLRVSIPGPHAVISGITLEFCTMSMPLNLTSPRRRGLTLLELIVVLVILVAVAGILIPLLPNMLGRAHTSVGATNINEVNRMVQVYYQTYDLYPNVLDNLVGSSSVLSYLPNYTPTGDIATVQMYTLSASDVAALNAVGITTVATLADTGSTQPTTFTPTFNPYSYASSGAVNTQTLVANQTTVASLLNTFVEGPNGIVKLDPTMLPGGTYVVFGFGKQTNAIGRVVTDAPVHFGEFAPDSATNVYCRYGLVFRTASGNGAGSGINPTPLTRAVFVGAVSFQTNGVYGTDGQLADYYDRVKKQD